ncbi:hypothetical protein FGU65_12775 [Methanoculleus sp. FWC-SCC1]|uniref:Uncharacterized protein n=1 Tax=Methanoculleus frigidifontis TaxID=2584085 RepID=A0ABT8MCS2_9EURY|nr:hypothetical protein [Methanoculleus sp. FWC-SCC1]MDN7025743.1 hypothetical protein [Methanoculleus sp. FWC-SCC1]
MEQAQVTQADIAREYDAIARQILERPESVPSAIHNVLLRLAETHPGAVYWIVRKFFQEYLKLYVSDTGYIGMVDRYVPGVAYPGDMAMYTLPENLKEGDLVQVIFTDKDEMRVYIVHGRVQAFNDDGSVDVEDIRSGEVYAVVPWNLLGKLAKVVPFRSDEWNEVFSASSVPQDWVATVIEENIASIRDSGLEGADTAVSEMQRRLATLV